MGGLVGRAQWKIPASSPSTERHIVAAIDVCREQSVEVNVPAGSTHENIQARARPLPCTCMQRQPCRAW